MRAYSSMPTEDFIYQLRQIAIGAKASPLVIDQIDALAGSPSEDEIKEREDSAALIAYEDCCGAIRKLDGNKDVGLTEMQIEQIMDALSEVAP